MAEVNTFNRAEDAPMAQAGDLDGMDASQLLNAVAGINRSKDGALQVLEEAKEFMGIVERGGSEYFTQEAKEEQALLDTQRTHASSRKGAQGAELVGEILPAFALPASAFTGLAKGAVTGGLLGAAEFQDDVNDSRVGSIATGAAIGGAFGKLFSGQARNAAKKLVGEMDATVKLKGMAGARQALEARQLGQGGGVQKGFPSGNPIMDKAREVARQRANNMNKGNAGPPAPTDNALSRAANNPANRQGGVARPVQSGAPSGAARAAVTQRAENLGQRAPTPAAVVGPPAKTTGMAGARAAAKARAIKFGGVQKGETMESIVKKGFSTSAKVKASLKKAAAEMKRAAMLARLKVEKLARAKQTPKVTQSLRKAEDDYMAALMIRGEINKTLTQIAGKAKAAVQKTVPKNKKVPAPAVKEKVTAAVANVRKKPVNSMNRGELAKELGLPPSAVKLHKDSLAARVRKQRHDQIQAERGVPLKGKGQGGFIDSKVAAIGGGAVLGGVAGGVAGDGNPMSVLAGAAGGALVGSKISKLAPRLTKTAKAREASKLNVGKAIKDVQGMGAKVKAAIAEIDKNQFNGSISELIGGVGETAENYLGAVITRLANINPKLADGMLKSEALQHIRAGKWLDQMEPMKKLMKKLSYDETLIFKKAVLGNRDVAATLLRKQGHNDIADELINTVGPLLDEMESYLKAAGYSTVHMRKNFFPRQVIDTAPFRTVPEVASHLEAVANAKHIVLGRAGEEDAITKLLNGQLGRKAPTKAQSAANLKLRKIDRITDANVDAYADPMQGLSNYIDDITRQVERQRFLEGNGAKGVVGPSGENLDSVAITMRKALTDGGMDLKAADEAIGLIKSRFGAGETAPHKLSQNFKNLTYTVLLANPMSAAVQFGDVALSAHANGLGRTVTALIKEMGNEAVKGSNHFLKTNLAKMGSGKTGVDKKSLIGLHDVAADFASNMKSRDILGAGLKWSGFGFMDKLGKNTFINASLSKNKAMSEVDFKNKWGRFFDIESGPKQLDDLYKQVQGFEKVTPENRENIGLMLANELSQTQPIFLSSLPQRYHDNPNGRMFYMLQSFNLKLLDTMRRDVGQKVAAKDYKGAAKAATTLGGYFVLMNASVDSFKDFVKGKPQKGAVEMVSGNMMRMFGLNKFVGEQMLSEGLGSAAMGMIAPPMALLDDPTRIASFGGATDRFTK